MVQLVNMGEKLRALRIENKMTQKQVADRIGLAVSAVSSYEAGSRYPSYNVLVTLARMFHTTTDHLLGIEKREIVDISDLSDDDKQVVKTMVTALRAKYLK